jgi:hypothetical protein
MSSVVKFYEALKSCEISWKFGVSVIEISW